MKIGLFLKDLASSWTTDKISTFSAALAYYTLFSLTPIILISVDLAGFFFSKDLARSEIMGQIQDLISADISSQINLVLENSTIARAGLLTQIIGWILIVIGSSAVFSEMQSGLNLIWGVTNPNRGLFTLLKQRLISFIMVLAVAMLLLISLVLSLALTYMRAHMSHFITVAPVDILLVHFISFLIVFLLFSMIFKILPDVKIPWLDIWIGAFITAILFHIGKYLLGIYLSTIPIATAFGAAGSLIILLIWVYYSAQIFFIGAEITKVIAFEKKEDIKTKRKALKIKTLENYP